MRLLLAVLLIPVWAFGQSPNEEEETPQPVFANLNAGFGMLYGGLGGNAEVGYSHFSIYGAYGYAPESADGLTVIKSSLNYQFGARYYLNVGSKFFFPRIGLGFGWVTNYHDDRITVPYDQHVNGLTMHLGMQIYSAEGLVISVDAGMGSKVAILNPGNHPHFFPFYIRPCVGIGYDLTRLYAKGGTRRLQNEEINPFE